MKEFITKKIIGNNSLGEKQNQKQNVDKNTK